MAQGDREIGRIEGRLDGINDRLNSLESNTAQNVTALEKHAKDDLDHAERIRGVFADLRREIMDEIEKIKEAIINLNTSSAMNNFKWALIAGAVSWVGTIASAIIVYYVTR